MEGAVFTVPFLFREFPLFPVWRYGTGPIVPLLFGMKKWVGDNSTTHLRELGHENVNQNH
jgi:hypothetical protein